jgi:hypothetical protein
MNHKLDTDKVLNIARQHLGNNSSARACMTDAIKAKDAGNLDMAARWALRSIAHSVGILHPDYSKAFRASGVQGEVRLVGVTL